MKIALVILHADPARGGAERYTVDLAARLRERGHGVCLLASSFAEDTGAAERVLLDASGWTRVGRYARFLSSLDGHLAATRYDIVHAMLPVNHCDVYHPHAGIAAEALASGHRKYASAPGRAMSWLGNRLNLRRRRFAVVERRLLHSEKVPVVLCLSQYIKHSLLRHYDLAPDRMAMLMNGVDLARFAPADEPARAEARRERGLADDKLIALFVAQDFQRKGLAEATRAVAAIGDPRLLLVVLGKDDPHRYAQLADDLAIRGGVAFVGTASDPRGFYAAADFLVLPTRHDPCSLVVLEALAMGVPVISTRQNGACEVMTSGREGLVLDDPTDIAALAAAMRALMDADKRAVMRKACLDLRSSLSQDAHVDKLIQVYEKVAGQLTPGHA